MCEFRVRTDLALEAKESFEDDNVEIRGVRIDENYDNEHEITITKVVIETKNGAKAMGKPMGTYITLEAPNMAVPDEGYHREISRVLAEYVKELLGKMPKEFSVLIAGLGNREVTPDSLGPLVVGNLLINRHVVKEYGKYAMGKERINAISGIVPGVMAQTGMETAEIIRGVIEETNPDLLIVVDALAARSTKRLSRTIQITDTGINPGSGVGNHRNAINEESMGIPVISIGVPTVVDAAVIVNDAMENMLHAMSDSNSLKDMAAAFSTFKVSEKHELFRELLSPQLNTMFVTPKDIDETMKRLSFTISEALNMVFQTA
ncbi:MAG: GPR endopeptidase [Lachnospiraceae bacterium]|nr:GPR endopeptidase [Lachnospiraceae bacterium]